jgi:hypothetical protein
VKLVDLMGTKCGRWSVVGPQRKTSDRGVLWKCICKCGKNKWVREHSLVQKLSKSCGCSRSGSRGGLTHTPLGAAFYNAKRRCTNPKHKDYSNYGGRGIQFKFKSFEQFRQELGMRPSKKYSIDRIDVDGHYEPGNVRWATKTQQNLNRRKFVSIQQFSDAQIIKEVKRRSLVIV